MNKGKSLLKISSLVLWLGIAVVGLLQIPIQSTWQMNSESISLEKHLQVYEMKDGSQDQFLDMFFKDMIDFRLYEDTDYAGSLTDSAFWFYIDQDILRAFMTGYEDELNLIEIGKPQLDHFTVYMLDQDRRLLSQKDFGRSLPFNEREYNHRNYYIELDTDRVDAVLFYVKTDSYLQFPIKLWHEVGWVDMLSEDMLGHGIFYGALLIMLVYNMILGISIKDMKYIYFSLFIFSYTLLQATWDGFAFQFLWPNSGLWDLRANPVFIDLVSMSLLGFTMNFLKLPRINKLKKVYLISMWVHLFSIFLVFVLPSNTSVYLSMFNAVSTLILAVIAIVSQKISSRAEVLFLLAWQFFIGANALNILAGLKLTPYTMVAELSPKVAILGLISIFSLALSEKLNTVEYLRGVEVEKRLLLKNLHEMHVKISSAQEIEDVFDYLLDMFHSITEYDQGMIGLLDRERRHMDIYDKEGKALKHLSLEEDVYADIYEELRRSGKSFYIRTVALAAAYGINDENIDIIPLVNLNHPIGFIALGSQYSVIINENVRETIEDFATQIAITIDNKRLLSNIIYQASHDFLTNAYNRRYFFDLAGQQLAGMIEGEILGTIMIDIDDFKLINDRYGHLIGDEVLSASVNLIRASIGPLDILGRYGGEEFIVLTKTRSMNDILSLAKNILMAFQEDKVSVIRDKETINLSVTASIGIATGGKEVVSLFSLTDAADRALYKAKEKGKNRIEVWRSGEPRVIPDTIKPLSNEVVLGEDKVLAFKLFGQINSSDEKNLVISPYSISQALGMAYLGARGEIKAELETFLGIEDIGDEVYKGAKKYVRQSLNSQDETNLEVSNSIWIRQGFEPKSQYLLDTAEVFDAYTYEVDFSDGKSVKDMNKWIEDMTQGKIDKIVEGPIDDLTMMYLLNTVYFNGQWKTSFKERSTKSMDFNNHDGRVVKTDFMRMKEDAKYYENSDMQALYLPYKGDRTGMFFIMPHDGIDIDSFTTDFSIGNAYLDDVMDHLKRESHVTIQIPKFKIESGPLFLVEDFKNLGLMAPFYSQTADFRGIYDGDKSLYISNIVHKAVFEIDEVGGCGAAATEVEVTKGEASEIVDPKIFIADRPFLFLVYDWETETILFMGKVKNF